MKRLIILPLVFIAIPFLTTGCITEDGLTIVVPLTKKIVVTKEDVCEQMKQQLPPDRREHIDCNGGNPGEGNLGTEKTIELPLKAFPVDIRNQLEQRVPDYAKRSITRLGVDKVTLSGNNGFGFALPSVSLYIVKDENTEHSGSPFATLPSIPNGTVNTSSSEGNHKEADRAVTELVKKGTFYVIPVAQNLVLPAETIVPPPGGLEVTAKMNISISFNPLKAITSAFSD